VKDFAGVAAIYNPDAALVPPTADDFIKGGTDVFEDFFKEGYDQGLKKIKTMKPTHVFEESATLWHEIGFIEHTLASSPYYCRWINNGGKWQIAFDILVIGSAP
jgi:hypothetical protein